MRLFYVSMVVAYLVSCTVSEIWQIIGQFFAVDREVFLFHALVRGEPLNSELRN